MASINQYLEAALKKRASDLHFISGDPARARVHGSRTTRTREIYDGCPVHAMRSSCGGRV